MVQLLPRRASKPVAVQMRIAQEVFVGRKGGPKDSWSYCFFVKLDHCKIAWEGHAHTKMEAADKAKSSLRASNVKHLIDARSGIDCAIVRFRLERYDEHGGGPTPDKTALPLVSEHWPILMSEMGLVAYGPPDAEARFRNFEAEGIDPRRQR
jgi:hypothetical protein